MKSATVCRKAHGRALARRGGSALVEMAFVLPVLLALGMGMIEFGQYFYAKHIVQSAARDGCRNAILGSATNTTVNTAISNTMSNAGFGNSGWTKTITDPTTNVAIANVGTLTRGSGIKVTVTVNYGSVGVRPLGVISATKPLVGITTMVKE